MASPAPADRAFIRELEPEARLVAAVFLQALKDARDRRAPERARATARAFLRGRGSFSLLCALGGLEPSRIARALKR